MKLVAKTAELQCQIAEYQATVSALTERLDDVSAQLNDSQENLSHSGKHDLIHTAAFCATVNTIVRQYSRLLYLIPNCLM